MKNNPPAHFVFRLVASLIDVAILWSLNLYLLGIVVRSETIPSLASNLLLFLIVGLLSPLGLLYTIFLTYLFGGTLGKLLTGLKVTNLEYRRLTFKRTMFRQTIGYMFSGLFFGLGYLAILKDDKKQAWHDKAVGSYVVQAGNYWIIGLISLIALLGGLGYYGAQTVQAAMNNQPLKQEFIQLYQDLQAQKAPKVSGGLKIGSEQKAKVFIEDKEVGETPFENNELDEGDYKVKLVSEVADTTPWEGTVHVNKGTIPFVYRDLSNQVLAGEVITLEAGKGLKVTSNPSEASVDLDGKTVGKTPLVIEDASLGQHKLILTKTGSQGRQISIDVLENFQTHLTMDLGAAEKTSVQNTTRTQSPAAQPVTYNYNDQDTASWKDMIDYTEMQATALNQWKNTDKDQAKLQQLIDLNNSQKAIATNLYTKMSQKKPLTAADNASIQTYDKQFKQYTDLAEDVFINQ